MRHNTKSIPLSEALRVLWSFVPSGGSLPEDVWRKRHRFLSGLTWFHALIIALVGPILGYSWEFSLEALFRDGTVIHTVGEGLIVALFAALASWRGASRTFQATTIGFGLISSSAILVHLSGGYIEFHFHFFVMLVFLALYQDWLPYILAIVYVAIHHGVVGVLWPEEVYNHPSAFNAPWTWAGIHAFFVLWASAGSVVAWRFNETASAQIQFNLERIRALREIDRAITSTLDLRAVLNVLMEKIDLVLPYSATTVRLFNKASGLLEPVACRNLDEKEWKAEQWKGGRGIPNAVFETKAPVMMGNVQTDPRTRDPGFFRRHGLVSYLGVPLSAKDEVLGVLSFYTKEEHQFDSEEVDFLTALAGQTAIAIHNSQLYEQTKKQAVELERANSVKGEFLSVMSHELRTPMNVVMGYAQMIKDGLLGEINPEQQKALEKMLNRSKDQLSMINNILQVTQLESQVFVVEREAVNLRELFDKLKLVCGVPVDKEVTLDWDYPSELSLVITDGEKLRHILQNLVNNAIKFTEKGSVKVSARRLSDPRRVEFKVADTGIGIPKESLTTVFEVFRQVDSSETRPYAGVGLGLYIVKKFAELLGGKVEVESELGKGSTFTVTIPVET